MALLSDIICAIIVPAAIGLMLGGGGGEGERGVAVMTLTAEIRLMITKRYA